MKTICIVGILLIAAILNSCEFLTEPLNMRIEKVFYNPQSVLSIRDTCTASEIGAVLGSLYGEAGKVLAEDNKLSPHGSVFAIYHRWAPPDTVILEACIPILDLPEQRTFGRVNAWNTHSTSAVVGHYFGPYSESEKAHEAIADWVEDNNLIVLGTPWEVYVTDPGVEKDSTKWQTDIYYPVQ